MENNYLLDFSSPTKTVEKNHQHTWTDFPASPLGQFLRGEPPLKTKMTNYSDNSVGAVGIRASS